MSGGRQKKNRQAHRYGEDQNMARKLDEREAYERFKEEVLPAIQKDLQKGFTAEELVQKYHALAMARNITIAINPKSQDSVALAASKDILDRALGKAKERSEVTHRMQDVPEEQLNAALLTKMKALNMSVDEDQDDDGRGPLQ